MSEKRRILACDGGGMRAMITLRCLEAFQDDVGMSCYDYFDMFAGTSGGAEVIGLLARDQPVTEVIRILQEGRDEMFTRNLLYPIWPKYRGMAAFARASASRALSSTSSRVRK